MFCKKKNLSVRRKIFKVWKGKNVSVEFRVFGKKMKIERKVRGKIKVVFWKLKMKDFAKFVFTGLASCWLRNSITWADLKDKVKIAVGNKNDCLLRKNLIKFSKYFSGRGLCLTHVGAPCCERTKSWVLYCKWTWDIFFSRTFGGSFTCVYTRGPWAVEYLAELSRILKLFSKSFKAMILGFNFI